MRYIALLVLVLVLVLAACAAIPHAQHQQPPQKPNTQQAAIARELANYLYKSNMTSQGIPAGIAWSCSPTAEWTFACTAPGYGTWTFRLPTGWSPAVGFNGKVTISPGS